MGDGVPAHNMLSTSMVQFAYQKEATKCERVFHSCCFNHVTSRNYVCCAQTISQFKELSRELREENEAGANTKSARGRSDGAVSLAQHGRRGSLMKAQSGSLNYGTTVSIDRTDGPRVKLTMVCSTGQ